MPRPNQPRSVHSETNLARRIAHERERLGMSYEGLADRMTKAGCAIQPSAIYKIEKAKPPRRISVDELVAFSAVFGVPVEQLLMPVELAKQEALRELLVDWEIARAARQKADEDEATALEAVKAYMREHKDMESTLQRFMESWAEQSSREPAAAHAYWMATFTDAEQWRQRLRELLDEEAAPSATPAAKKTTARSRTTKGGGTRG